MRNRVDIVLVNNDIYIDPNVNDLPLQPSDAQHITDIINASPGWYKQYPQLGVGILLYLNSPGRLQQLLASVRLQLQSDGYSSNPTAVFSNNSLYSITANASLN